MKNKLVFLFSVTLSVLALSGCNNEFKCNHDFDLHVMRDSDWHTFIAGQDFNPKGLKVQLGCKICHQYYDATYTLENDKDLQLDQTSVTIKWGNLTIDYPIVVKEKYRIACIGDSLTAGHNWPNQSYPSYLAQEVDEIYEVGNFGVNGISITGYGGSWKNPDMRYIKQDVYANSLAFEPDIFAIMLGTNDATEWSKAEPTFREYYEVLLDSYRETFPNARFIMMVSPPVVTPNQFGIPNDEIRDYVNPIQRELAEDYDFEMIDLREEFEATEDYQSKFLRPNNDNVHFTEEGAQYVANRVWEVAKDLTF